MIFVNNPVGLDATLVENQGLLGANDMVGASCLDFTVFTSGLPVASLGSPVVPVT